jgi:osmoprotectant transport system ATP-binding protein
MHPGAITFEDVSVRFGAATAVDGITLAVAPQTFLAVVGGSGSGKTTLLRLVNRLLEPSLGRVTLAGADVRSLDAVVLRRRVGYVFQGIGLFPHMTVAENIGITPRLLGWPRADIEARVGELLALVRLDPAYGPRRPAQLSGGERQRVGVARALAARPEIVLMDEPFAALDPITRDALGQDTRRLHDSLGLTTLMITHDMLEALALADRIAILDKGRLIAEGTPAEVMANPHPYVRELMQMPRRLAERVDSLARAGAPT